jgi:hypothetical protein
MLNKMSMLLAATAVVALSAGAAAADPYDNHDRRDTNGAVSVTVGDPGLNSIAFGYRDGYWDNGHQWHRWHNRHDSRAYRNQTGASYHDWNHDRDHDMGWSRP